MSTFTTSPTGWTEHKSHWHWRWWLQWIAANALSEMIGLGLTVRTILFLLGMIALAGALVGAIHGLVLLWLLRRNHDQNAPLSPAPSS